jgi:poly(A) polymerase
MATSFSKAIEPGARQVGTILHGAGHQALLAGGCVRDLLLERQPKDWDIVTDATPDQVAALFERTVDIGGRRFGIQQVTVDHRVYEVAQLRCEDDYGDGRHPDTIVYTSDPRQDAARRDFTINGMLFDLVSEELIDVVGGRADLQDGILRAIGDPISRFAEDHLRLLRAIRFAARFQFTIEADTWAAITTCAPQILSISAERIRDELSLILTEGRAADGFRLLFDCGLLRHLLPEVAALDGVAQPPEYHPEGDVWQHLQLMLAEVDCLSTPDLELAWGVLLHDIGKPATFEQSDRIRFHGHDLLGAQMANDIARRLRMSNELRRRIVELTRHHMRFHNTPKMRAGKLRRFLSEPFFPQLLALHRIDCIGCHGKLDLYDFCCEQHAAILTEAEVRGPLVNGDDLIGLGYEPGPEFARMIRWVEDEEADGRFDDKVAAIAALTRRFPLPGAP